MAFAIVAFVFITADTSEANLRVSSRFSRHKKLKKELARKRLLEGSLLSKMKRSVLALSRIPEGLGRDQKRKEILDELILFVGQNAKTCSDCSGLWKKLSRTKEASVISQHMGSYEHHVEIEKSLFSKTASLDDFDLFGGSEKLEQLISDELALVPGSQEKSIAFIGSGPFPLTPILASNHVNTKITLVDSSIHAMASAQYFLREHGLFSKFSYARSKAEEMDFSSFDMVWLAAMVSPKENVIPAIKQSLSKDALILDRQMVNFGQLFFGPKTKYGSLEDLEVVDVVDSYLDMPMTSTLLK